MDVVVGISLLGGNFPLKLRLGQILGPMTPDLQAQCLLEKEVG
jgi:hypothetical protein